MTNFYCLINSQLNSYHLISSIDFHAKIEFWILPKVILPLPLNNEKKFRYLWEIRSIFYVPCYCFDSGQRNWPWEKKRKLSKDYCRLYFCHYKLLQCTVVHGKIENSSRDPSTMISLLFQNSKKPMFAPRGTFRKFLLFWVRKSIMSFISSSSNPI